MICQVASLYTKTHVKLHCADYVLFWIVDFFREGQEEVQSATADLVVGCDGAYSTVRRQIMRASR